MKLKFYKKLLQVSLCSLLLAFNVNKLQAQNQGLYIDTIKWPNSNAITINIKAKSFNNVINFAGSIHWDKNSLQYVSQSGNASLGASNYSFGVAAVSQGVLTYIYSDVSAFHTVADGTNIITINFNIINNPVSTYNDNVISFANAPTPLGIDTTTDIAGLSDYGSILYPNLENHLSGYVSFARPAVLSNSGTDITDSVTNRPVGCTYQWFQNGNPIAGPASSNYPSAPAGLDSVRITYPNGTVVSCIAAVLPVKLNSFNGRSVDNTNQLSWSTATEINTNIFDIERSANGRDFSSIGKVKAVGNSSTSQNYQFTDANTNNAAMYYYRLKVVDNNGTYSYSNIIRISKDNKTTISLYPNPSRNTVTIEGEKMEKIVVTDLFGKTVMVKNLNAVNNTSLNISGLAKGYYNVSVTNANNTKSLKLIVE